MRFLLHTHDAWGIVTVGNFSSLVEAQQAFTVLCEDPWYRQDGGVMGVELVEDAGGGMVRRLDWFPF